MENENLFCETVNLINRIRSNQRELEELQSKCNHHNYSLKNIGPENGTMFELRRICDDCNKCLGIANKKELYSWLEK